MLLSSLSEFATLPPRSLRLPPRGSGPAAGQKDFLPTRSKVFAHNWLMARSRFDPCLTLTPLSESRCVRIFCAVSKTKTQSGKFHCSTVVRPSSHSSPRLVSFRQHLFSFPPLRRPLISGHYVTFYDDFSQSGQRPRSRPSIPANIQSARSSAHRLSLRAFASSSAFLFVASCRVGLPPR